MPTCGDPSALAVSVARGGVEIYVTDEGRESAILLTSFGIPVPATGGDARLPLPTDIVHGERTRLSLPGKHLHHREGGPS